MSTFFNCVLNAFVRLLLDVYPFVRYRRTAALNGRSLSMLMRGHRKREYELAPGGPVSLG